MNKFTKSILALGLALSILIGVSGTSVFAASHYVTMINGYYATAVSNISSTNAAANTTFATKGRVSVESTYTYVNTQTLNAIKITKSSNTLGSSTVSFVAPSNCRSVSIYSKHRVDHYGKSWTVVTNNNI